MILSRGTVAPREGDWLSQLARGLRESQNIGLSDSPGHTARWVTFPRGHWQCLEISVATWPGVGGVLGTTGIQWVEAEMLLKHSKVPRTAPHDK